MNDFDELIGGVGVERARILLGIHKMRADMILDHFGHESCDGPADAGNHVHDALAFGFLTQGPLDCFHLTSDPTDPRKQLFLLSEGMAHGGNTA